MTKSIEEKRDALAEKEYSLNDAGHLSDSAYYELAGGHDGFKVGFDAGYVEGTKDHDSEIEQLKVENERLKSEVIKRNKNEINEGYLENMHKYYEDQISTLKAELDHLRSVILQTVGT